MTSVSTRRRFDRSGHKGRTLRAGHATGCTAAKWAASALALSAGFAHAQLLDFHAVALSGTPAPGLGGAVRYVDFLGPCINRAGVVAFQTRLIGPLPSGDNDSAIFAGLPGALAVAARQRGAIAGVPGITLNQINSPNINDAGQVAFGSSLTGLGVTASSDFAIFSAAPAGPSLVAREGDPAAGVPGSTYLMMSGNAPSRAADGRFSLFAALGGAAGGSNAGIWTGGPGALELVARQGGQAPGLPAGVTFSSFASTTFAASAGGGVVVEATVTGPGVTGANNSGVWSLDAGSARLIARRGDAAPGLPAGTQFANFNAVRADSAGSVIFRAGLTGGGSAADDNVSVWRGAPGGPRLIVRTGVAAPGAGIDTKLRQLNLASANDAGQAAVLASLVGPAVTTESSVALVLAAEGSLTLIAQGEGAVPGLDLAYSRKFGAVQLNNAGQMVFENYLGSDLLTRALLAYDPAAGVFPIAYQGGPIQLVPGDVRVVRDFFGVTSAAAGEAGPRQLNDAGVFVFGAMFTDGSQAVITTTIPAPAGLLPLGLLLAPRRRR